MEREFEIWMSGFAITGNQQGAQFIGKAKGETFKEACQNYEYPEDILGWNKEVIVHKGDKLKLDAHYDWPSIWACKLYDNEVDARKSFG